MHFAYIYIFSNKYKKNLSLLITIQKQSRKRDGGGVVAEA